MSIVATEAMSFNEINSSQVFRLSWLHGRLQGLTKNIQFLTSTCSRLASAYCVVVESGLSSRKNYFSTCEWVHPFCVINWQYL